MRINATSLDDQDLANEIVSQILSKYPETHKLHLLSATYCTNLDIFKKTLFVKVFLYIFKGNILWTLVIPRGS